MMMIFEDDDDDMMMMMMMVTVMTVDPLSLFRCHTNLPTILLPIDLCHWVAILS